MPEQPSADGSVNPNRLRFAEVTTRWRKARGYTTVVGLAVLDILFLIFCLVSDGFPTPART